MNERALQVSEQLTHASEKPSLREYYEISYAVESSTSGSSR